MKSFIYFCSELHDRFVPLLSSFLESQRELKLIGLSFLKEIVENVHGDTDRLLDALKDHRKHIDSLEGANECYQEEAGDQLLKTFYYFDNTDDNVLTNEHNRLIRDVKRIFPRVKNLLVHRIPGCLDEDEAFVSSLGSWRTAEKLTYLDENSSNVLSHLRVGPNCNNFRLCFRDETCDVEEWKVFLASNSHVKHFHISTLWFFEDDEMFCDFLSQFAILSNLESLELFVYGLRDHHMQLIVDMLQNLKSLKIRELVWDKVTEDTKKRFQKILVKPLGVRSFDKYLTEIFGDIDFGDM